MGNAKTQLFDLHTVKTERCMLLKCVPCYMSAYLPRPKVGCEWTNDGSLTNNNFLGLQWTVPQRSWGYTNKSRNCQDLRCVEVLEKRGQKVGSEVNGEERERRVDREWKMRLDDRWEAGVQHGL